jgi:hypothetical protein
MEFFAFDFIGTCSQVVNNMYPLRMLYLAHLFMVWASFYYSKVRIVIE